MVERQPLSEFMKENYATKFRRNLKLTWYFEKTYEKAIIVILSSLGLLRIVQWII